MAIAPAFTLLFQALEHLDVVAANRGIRPCLYDYVDGLRGAGLARRFFTHQHPFCMRVKKKPEGHKACMADDHQKILWVFRSGKLSGERVCHGGIRELIFPFTQGRRLVGGLFLGPFLNASPLVRKGAGVPVVTGAAKRELKSLGLLVQATVQEYLDHHKDAPAATLSPLRKGGLAAPSAHPMGGETRVAAYLSPEIKRAVEIISQDFQGPLTLKALQGRFPGSPTHMGRQFKREVGVGFSRYLLEIRVAHSVTLLKKTDLPVVDIANRSGFETAVGFIKAFKKIRNMPPGAFRNINWDRAVVVDAPGA